VVEALLWAVEHPHDLVELLVSTRTRTEARVALQRQGLTEFQAEHVLDMSIARLIQQNVADLSSELDALRRWPDEEQVVQAPAEAARHTVFEDTTADPRQ